jgi:peptidoglycan/LPS O-acetylase OafA/YrhL
MFTRFISFINKPIKPPLLNHGYSKHVEQYRGLCAILVLLAHGFGDERMLINNFKWPLFMHYLSAGYLSVLVFFCISGYVIGITNDKEKLDVKGYLKKRAIRLYPTYLVAIALSVIIAGGASLLVLTGNILFLQNEMPYFNFKIPILVNYPVWSLNFEAIYYLLFILVFLLKPKVWKMLLLMLILSIALVHFNGSFEFLTRYINGFYFWMLGLLIGWSIFKTDIPKDRSIPLLSLLFLHMSIHHLGIGEIILHVIGVYSETNINWLFDLPFCLMVMCVLTAKDNAFLRFNKILTYTLPACVFLYLVLHHRITEDLRWVMCLIFWVLSLMFYYERKVSAFLLERLTSIGKISYALYLLHVPVAMLIKKTIFINDLKVEAAVKYFLWISITFTLSFVLERILQPAVKKYFLPR